MALFSIKCKSVDPINVNELVTMLRTLVNCIVPTTFITEMMFSTNSQISWYCRLFLAAGLSELEMEGLFGEEGWGNG